LVLLKRTALVAAALGVPLKIFDQTSLLLLLLLRQRVGRASSSYCVLEFVCRYIYARALAYLVSRNSETYLFEIFD